MPVNEMGSQYPASSLLRFDRVMAVVKLFPVSLTAVDRIMRLVVDKSQPPLRGFLSSSLRAYVGRWPSGFVEKVAWSVSSVSCKGVLGLALGKLLLQEFEEVANVVWG